MVKSVMKEIFIMLLLYIAIALILGILFYNYIPTNRVIPTKEAYVTPNDIKEEINEQITEIEKTEISYEVTDADLNIYKKSSSYKPGKKDPFSLTETTENTTSTNTSTDNNDNNNSNNSDDNKNKEQKNDTKTNQNSTQTFFNETGIK